jgi:thiosulfate/3-mercaptopyruvate sulfurtransferase
VDPLELADLLMKGEKGVLLVDLREPEAYGRFHLRGALNIPLEELTAQAGTRLPKDTRIVLYSNGTTHAAQAWLQLRHWGWTDVKVLTDGILGFWRECLTPSSLAGSIDDVSAGKQYAAYLARRNFFLKEPAPR